ncbi:MAG: DEAD/DEAH box helicase [Candidatus Kerfeldbacteria bacterium]|nr:DEAD/DEAH box helicase [Candidatus Kerfeldbacteria bacterium]
MVQRIGQIPNITALAHFLSTSPLTRERAVFIVVNNLRETETLMQLLPHLDALHRNRARWRNDILELSALGSSLSHFWVTDTETTNQTILPSPTGLLRQSLRIEKETTLSMNRVKTFLAEHGYEREATANARGRWATRGDIIDIYINQPIRVQFHDDRVESIQPFDLETGKMHGHISTFIIPPLNLRGRSTALDHLTDDALLVVYHQTPLNTSLTQVVAEPFFLPNSTNAGYTEAKAYHLRYETMQHDAHGKHLIAFTQEKEKVESIFAAEHPTIYHSDVMTAGCVNDNQGVMILTDASIGFAAAREQKKSNRIQQATIRKLAPGDYVVHLYHGIARFNRMETMHVNGLNRDYFVLEYAGNDKIYLPVELADRIDSYVGATHPQLNRLSTASWNEAVQRVKEQSLETARDLLNLYAQRSQSHAPQIHSHREEETLDRDCPFTLTTDQTTALQDIMHDLGQEKPMDRLLCGDVGFGKTEVALRAAFRTILNGYQVALLAPTTILAQQHVDTLTERLATHGPQIASLSRFRSAAEQKTIVNGLRNGTVDLVVGTHRLFSKDIQFKHLGLIIIDEEQRFGVKAKEALTRLRKNAHVLTMTATPIPRTLHLSLSGIRDISTILTPPQERKPVVTSIAHLTTEIIRDAVTRELQRQGQTYYLYNRVQSIERRLRELQAIIPDARFGIAHGQMPSRQLASIMHQFDTGEIDVLLASTIIENGLDIPRANTVIVEDASNFGLSELYQLKGRVGRASEQGYAYFLYTEQVPDGDAKKRFVALSEANYLGAGFELAMKDMEIRGVGNMLGKEQHGHAIKIGLNLYVRLLNQAMSEMEGIPPEPTRDIPIDLPLEARIPESVVEDIGDRILLYQQLANLTDIDMLYAKREELAHQHSSFEGLFDLLEIKLLASHSPLLSIDTTYPTTENQLSAARITLSSDQPFAHIPDEWEPVFSRTQTSYKIRATLDALGDGWVQQLKTLLRTMQ